VVTEVVTVDEAENRLSAGVKRRDRFGWRMPSSGGADNRDGGYRGYRLQPNRPAKFLRLWAGWWRDPWCPFSVLRLSAEPSTRWCRGGPSGRGGTPFCGAASAVRCQLAARRTTNDDSRIGRSERTRRLLAACHSPPTCSSHGLDRERISVPSLREATLRSTVDFASIGVTRCGDSHRGARQRRRRAA
jgi:hypothetical protein